jgi:hypothetical protein
VKAKREIKQVYDNVESRYKDVMAIIDKKMEGRFNSPLHLSAYLLNPHYSYADPSIFDDDTITVGFMNCVETFYHDDEDKQDQAVNVELQKFQNREGSFAKRLARTYQNFDFNPGTSFLEILFCTTALEIFMFLHFLFISAKLSSLSIYSSILVETLWK